jgi:hypothetical protein
MKLTPLNGELKKFVVVCGRSDITPTMDTRSEDFHLKVKWKVKPEVN